MLYLIGQYLQRLHFLHILNNKFKIWHSRKYRKIWENFTTRRKKAKLLHYKYQINTSRITNAANHISKLDVFNPNFSFFFQTLNSQQYKVQEEEEKLSIHSSAPNDQLSKSDDYQSSNSFSEEELINFEEDSSNNINSSNNQDKNDESMQKEENEIKKMNDENIQNNIVFEEEESKQEEIDDQNMSIDKIDQNSSQEIPQNSMILPENKIKSNNKWYSLLFFIFGIIVGIVFTLFFTKFVISS